MEIRPMVQRDLVEQYGHGFPFTVRGITVEHDGRAIGVAGIMFSKPPQCFSKLDDEVKEHPRSIVTAMRVLRKMLDSQSVPVYATPDEDEPTANKFLKHVGFEETNTEGVWKWVQQQSH